MTLAFMSYFIVPGGHFLPGCTAKSFLHTSIIIPVDLEYVRNMAENSKVETETGISPVVVEYERWKDIKGVSTLGQALHPAVINNIPWEKDTPKEIAEFVLSKDRQEVLDWVDDRKGLFHLENDDDHKKVHEVMKEVKNVLRREKINNHPLVEADLRQS
jgi:hypothetical protein